MASGFHCALSMYDAQVLDISMLHNEQLIAIAWHHSTSHPRPWLVILGPHWCQPSFRTPPSWIASCIWATTQQTKAARFRSERGEAVANHAPVAGDGPGPGHFCRKTRQHRGLTGSHRQCRADPPIDLPAPNCSQSQSQSQTRSSCRSQALVLRRHVQYIQRHYLVAVPIRARAQAGRDLEPGLLFCGKPNEQSDCLTYKQPIEKLTTYP